MTFVCRFVSLSLAISLLGLTGAFGASVETLEVVHKKALKEGGTLNFYGTLAQVNAEKILPVFEKQFPGIKVNHVDATSDKLVARAVTEFGHVDVMCNNAAAPGTDKFIWEQTLENWNATIATDHTDGEPPSFGSTILVNIGCTTNRSSAETKSVIANSPGASRNAPMAAAEVDAAATAAEIAEISSSVCSTRPPCLGMRAASISRIVVAGVIGYAATKRTPPRRAP